MAETLVQVIRSVENLSDSISVSKEKLIKDVWDEWYANNLVVRDITDGKTTFLKEYEKLYDGYEGFKQYTPFLVSKGFAERALNLNSCIEEYGVHFDDDGASNLIINPIGGGLSGALLFSGLYSATYPLAKRKEKFNRREFFKKVGGAAILGGLGGLFWGGMFSWLDNKEMNRLETNAIYLDNSYNKYIAPNL